MHGRAFGTPTKGRKGHSLPHSPRTQAQGCSGNKAMVYGPDSEPWSDASDSNASDGINGPDAEQWSLHQ